MPKIFKKTVQCDKVRMRDNLQIAIISMLLILLLSCSTPVSKTFVFPFDSRLADGKKVMLVFEIDFKDKKSVKNLEKNIQKIEYALTMVFSKIHSNELEKDREMRAKNALGIILKRHFKDKPKDIRLASFSIQ